MNKKSTSKTRPVVARTVEPVVGEFGVWLDAKKFCPMKSDNVQRFIVILESQARAEHCKTWGGMGEPETCSYYHAWGSTGWNGRGGLSVAYWMPLPKFTGQWNRGGPNECGHWDVPNPKIDGRGTLWTVPCKALFKFRIERMQKVNTWPNGHRHAISQSEHEAWNARNFPGTRQLCAECGEPTGRCEDDSLYADDDGQVGPLCEQCWNNLNPVVRGATESRTSPPPCSAGDQT